MPDDSSVARWQELFVGRQDAFAEQLPDGSYRPIRRKMTAGDVADHLAGLHTYAIYPLLPDATTSIIVWDFDVPTSIPDYLRIAEEASSVLANRVTNLGFTCYREFSGQKGVHVWMFVYPSLSVDVARSFALNVYGLCKDSIPSEVTVETFPKQSRARKYGNPIKLPCGVHRVTNGRCDFLDDHNEPVDFEDWISQAKENQAQDVILASEHSMPTTDDGSDEGAAPGQPTTGTKIPCIERMISSGVARGLRHHAAFYLACHLKRSCVPREAALGILEQWDTSNDPPLASEGDEGELRRSVDSVYDGDQTPFPCSNIQVVRAFCDTSTCVLKRSRQIARAGAAPPQGAPTEASLSQIGDARWSGKLVRCDVLCAGKLDAPYHVPWKVSCRCGGWMACDEDRARCPLRAGDGLYEREFQPTERALLSMIGVSDAVQQKALKDAVGIASPCRKFVATVDEFATIEEVMMQPKADYIRASSNPDGGVAVDDGEGHEYVARRFFYHGHGLQTNAYYRIVCTPTAHPRTQTATALVQQADPLQDTISSFELDDGTRAALRAYSAMLGDGDLADRVDALLLELEAHVTGIRQRPDAHLAVLLAYFSPLGFLWDGRLQRGWTEVLMLGDTGEGKSKVVEGIMDEIRLGEKVSGEAAGRTGLTYALEKVGDSFFLTWGSIVRNDRRLVVIDEAEALPEFALKELRQTRDGVCRVRRVKWGEAPARTRILFVSNPREDAAIRGDGSEGCEKICSLMEKPDIRRLDVAVILAHGDVPLAVVNAEERPEPVPRRLPPGALRLATLWAWSRRPDQVTFDHDCRGAVIEATKRLTRLYGFLDDLPLVSVSDMRFKLARLSAALAALELSSDGEMNVVRVRRDHVEFVTEWLDSVYSHDNFGLDRYAREKRATAVGTETLVIRALRALKNETPDLRPLIDGCDRAPLDMARELCHYFHVMPALTALRQRDLCEELGGVSSRAARALIRRLVRLGLVEETSSGCRRSSLLQAVASRLDREAPDWWEVDDGGVEGMYEDEEPTE